MGYCEVLDVRNMMKDDVLNTIIGDNYIENTEEREKVFSTIIQNAISDAEGEVDGYLAKRYPVPLTTVPKSITKVAKDIAVYNLYSRIGIDEADREKNYLNRYNSSISFLKMVAEGKADLDIGSQSSQSISTGFSVRSNERLFSRGSMRGM